MRITGDCGAVAEIDAYSVVCLHIKLNGFCIVDNALSLASLAVHIVTFLSLSLSLLAVLPSSSLIYFPFFLQLSMLFTAFTYH